MRYWLEYIPFIITATIVKALPRSTAFTLGGWLGSLGRFVQPRRVRIATDNLQHAYPEMSAEEISLTIKKMFSHLGKSFIDMLRLDQYNSQQDLEKYYQVAGQENINKALELNRGCIILTGHVGFWEAGNFFIPKLGFRFGVVAKPIHNPLVD
ncbi:MAG: hypothetical protein GWO23_21785, partial [Gammaproteobacteria bacterium]|nr:hypothetical protein [Gammaproteobacteria bacterium]